MRNWFLVGVCLFAGEIFTAIAGENGGRLEKFEQLTTAQQEKQIAKNTRKNGDYYEARQVGRYTVFSDISAASAYNWALILDEFTGGALDEGIFPKQFVIATASNPQVYILGSAESYRRALSQDGIDAPEWSAGLFTSKTPALYAKKSTSEEAMRSIVLHEATHQLMFYHVGLKVPVWFNEGFATNLEAYDTARNMRANLYNFMYESKRAAMAVDLSAKKNLVPFAKLSTILGAEWSKADDATAEKNYASAWATANFFFTNKKGREIVGKYLSGFKSGGDAPKIDAAKIDADLAEHLAHTVAPAVKYGRPFLAAMRENKRELAAKILEKMSAEFPENNETLLAKTWLSDDNTVKTHLTALEKLVKTESNFYHPYLQYVIAKSYAQLGDKTRAKTALSKALKDNRKCPLTLQLKQELK